MDSREQTLAQVLDAFPNQFDFYHLGKVELQSELLITTQESTAIAFRIQGDLNAWVVVLFEKGLDVPTYSELGNILVSKIVTQISSQTGVGVMVSPPHLLEEAQTENIIRSTNPITRRTYAHFYKNSVIPIETWILPASSEGIGYA